MKSVEGNRVTLLLLSSHTKLLKLKISLRLQLVTSDLLKIYPYDKAALMAFASSTSITIIVKQA